MTNLFEEYPVSGKTPAKASSGVNLFDEYNPNNRPGTDEEALELAKKQIAQKYPNMPDWLRDAILSATPKQESPMLDSAARGVSNVTDVIPAMAGGALQGASVPIRGVAGLIPTEFTQRLANSPDLRTLFPKAEGLAPETAQLGAEILGGGGLFGKLFQGAKYASQAAKVPKMLQNATALGVTGAVGTPGDAEDRAIGAGSALGLGAAGKVASKAAQKVAPIVRGLFSEANPEALVASVQKPHDILDNSANELYGQVKEAIKNRGIKIPLPEDLIEKAREHFPKNTTSYQDLLRDAKEGDYDAIHKIQSSLYKKGTKALSSDDLSVENQGEDILDLRDKINDALNNHLIGEGHLDIAHVLGQGKKIYSQLQQTYYDKLLPKAIGKLVHPETRLIPENPENMFKQNSVPMKQFLQVHPEAQKHAMGIAEKKAALKALKKLGYITGGSGATVAGSKALYDLFN